MMVILNCYAEYNVWSQYILLNIKEGILHLGNVEKRKISFFKDQIF